jgi:hypothetical protein
MVLQYVATAALACSACFAARVQHFSTSVAGPGQQQAHVLGKEQQRQWEFEAQLWLLLPTVAAVQTTTAYIQRTRNVLQPFWVAYITGNGSFFSESCL